MSDNQDEPKIHVDEDWKSQVEQEKEAARNQQAEPTSEVEEIPPASFVGLLSMLGSQAMAALGVMPDFVTGEVNVNRPLAKHCIDMLSVLKEKTNGNLDEDEAAHLRDALHQLRMLYVSTGNQTPPSADNDADSGPSIELP